MAIVFALSGWKGSGKDEVSSYLCKQYNATRVSLADPLKENTAKQYNLDLNIFHDVNLKDKPILGLVAPKDLFALMICKHLIREFRDIEGNIYKNYVTFDGETSGFFGVDAEYNQIAKLYWTPRALLIAEGSLKRTVENSFWVKKAIHRIGSQDTCVISDLRYKSEMEQLRSILGDALITVRINRHAETASTDASERDLDNENFDFILNNSKTENISLEELYAQVDLMMEKTINGL